MSTKHGKAVCGSVRCERLECLEAYERTCESLEIETLGEGDCAYVDVFIYLVGGAFHTATLSREDVNSLCDPAWRKRVDTFNIPTNTGGTLRLFVSMITSIEERSDEH